MDQTLVSVDTDLLKEKKNTNMHKKMKLFLKPKSKKKKVSVKHKPLFKTIHEIGSKIIPSKMTLSST